MQKASEKLWKCIEPVVTGLGYEFVGAEYGQGEGGNTLRVYIDQKGGILLDDCAAVSNQLGAVLDVEEPIQSKYVLEVSSPGIDRPLFKVQHYIDSVGKMIKVRTYSMVLDRRNFRGILESFEDNTLYLKIDGLSFAIPIETVERAQVLSAI